ncbi:unnamed protein product [Rotaria sp. Silwood1]|nr:unnamed protein product [Rotaria sp. Silwood1]
MITTATTITTTTTTSSTATISTTSTTMTTTTTTAVQALSLLATVTASNFYTGVGTATAQGDALVDRSQTGAFSSGNFAPQYVQLEFPGVYSICNVCLRVGQYPDGVTQHEISVGANVSSLQVVSNLTGYTYNTQWLNITFNPWLSGISFIRVTTTSSPSWVAWFKFLVYGV